MAAAVRLFEHFAKDNPAVVAQMRGLGSHCAACRRDGAREGRCARGRHCSAVGAEHSDKLSEHRFFHLTTKFCLPPVCRSAILSHFHYRDLCHPHLTRTSCEKSSFRLCFGNDPDPCGPPRSICVFRKLVISRQTTNAYYLRTTSPESPSLRLQYVTHRFHTAAPTGEVRPKITAAVDESLSKQQKALFLCQQLAAINAGLQRLEVGNSDLHSFGNAVEDED